MNVKWLFRFVIPRLAVGQPISAAEAEKVLLDQLQTKQRSEEDVLWELAQLYSLTKRQAQALECVKRLVAMAKDLETKAGCYLAMGQLMEQKSDFEQAIRYYSEAMVLEPVNSKTWYFIHNNLGYCLNHCGRHEEAVPYLERAIDLDPLRHNAYKNMGIACEGLGQLTDAALFYIKAVQTNASDPRSLMHLELLAQKHPDLTVAVPNFEAHLQACRMAVRHAQQMGMEVAQGILPEQDRSGAPKV